jgi:dTDP-4-amino-4,6-dideoxygalactose transaminase
MAETDLIMAIARRHDFHVIEDACQSLGADYHGRRAGSIGHFGCFSFFPSKNLGGAGDNGMVVCNNPGLADRVSRLRTHGARPKYHHREVGGNFRMDALQASILGVKFKHLEEWTAGHQKNAALYRKAFLAAGLASEDPQQRLQMPVVLPKETGWGRHIYHLYQMCVQARNELMAFLKDRHVGTDVYYPVPLHLQACFAELDYKPGSMPDAERAAQETLALPIYPELTKDQISYVVDIIRSFYMGGE